MCFRLLGVTHSSVQKNDLEDDMKKKDYYYGLSIDEREEARILHQTINNRNKTYFLYFDSYVKNTILLLNIYIQNEREKSEKKNKVTFY